MSKPLQSQCVIITIARRCSSTSNIYCRSIDRKRNGYGQPFQLQNCQERSFWTNQDLTNAGVQFGSVLIYKQDLEGEYFLFKGIASDKRLDINKLQMDLEYGESVYRGIEEALLDDSRKHGKLDQEEDINRSLGQVVTWRQETDQQFREEQDKLRPLPDDHEIALLQRQLAVLKIDIEAKKQGARRKAAERQPTPPAREPEPEPEPESEDTGDLRNKVQKLEELQQTSAIAKLENTVDILQSVLTQKKQSETQTVPCRYNLSDAVHLRNYGVQGCNIRIFLIAICSGTIKNETIRLVPMDGQELDLQLNCRETLTLSTFPVDLTIQPQRPPTDDGEQPVGDVAVVRWDLSSCEGVCEGLIVRYKPFVLSRAEEPVEIQDECGIFVSVLGRALLDTGNESATAISNELLQELKLNPNDSRTKKVAIPGGGMLECSIVKTNVKIRNHMFTVKAIVGAVAAGTDLLIGMDIIQHFFNKNYTVGE